ncbi:cation:proton antiporter [Sphingomonas changnyeongensis]|uniref:Cation:proton antiporter n=1 Tax=Sphingomonas changnyeongensis TaxID=2698679 RepID=A0A7Z2NW28_9SPHN|nr:cation:proton antiporter [Sphingomonas changnyeongensis]QHL90787.1 cation:proton antiporter [Sphingomonas changnyeongensis]
MSAGAQLLVQAALLIAGPWLLWRLFGLARIVPLAVLQIVTGVLLGPAILGRIAPGVQAAIFPPGSAAAIGTVAQIGVVLYAFATGMHLDSLVLRRSRGLALIAAGSFLVPLAAGFALAVPLARVWPETLPPGTPFGLYAAALALLLSVTALPVLAALLDELGLIGTGFGQRALGLAAITDAGMWLCVAAILLVAGGAATVGSILWLPAYGLLLWAAGRGLAWLAGRGDMAAPLILAAAFAALSAALADMIGLGAVIGAFAAGMIVPARLRADIRARIEWPALFLLMPFFFMATGLRITADLLSPALVALVLLLTGAAVIAKVAGVALAARIAGLTQREGLALGVALQTKGLMEVLVATILVERGVIGGALFAPLVLMALACTLLTGPLLRVLSPATGAKPHPLCPEAPPSPCPPSR